MDILTRLYVDFTAEPPDHSQTTLKIMADMVEIFPKVIIPTLPPLPGIAPLEHAPRMGDGPNSWPLACVGIVVTAEAAQQPRQLWMRTSPLNSRGK
jgi:hypothetical protein